MHGLKKACILSFCLLKYKHIIFITSSVFPAVLPHIPRLNIEKLKKERGYLFEGYLLDNSGAKMILSMIEDRKNKK